MASRHKELLFAVFMIVLWTITLTQALRLHLNTEACAEKMNIQKNINLHLG
jgi:hypothetical protein